MSSSKWEKVGTVGVDAGLIIVGDPCYFATPDATEHIAKTWGDFCDFLFVLDKEFDKNGYKQLNYGAGHPGLGVVVSTGYGDGVYPVFIKKNEEGRVVRLMVKFD